MATLDTIHTFAPGELTRGRVYALLGWTHSQAFGRDGGVTTGTFGDSGYFREIDGAPHFFHGTPGHGVSDSGLIAEHRRQTARVVTTGGTHTIAVHPERGGGAKVVESGSGDKSGTFNVTHHPDATSAARDATQRLQKSETIAKLAGKHVATLEKVDGQIPAGESRYIVKPGIYNESGQPSGHHIIDRITGAKTFAEGPRSIADATVARMEANAATATPGQTPADPVEANAATARERVAARRAAATPTPTRKPLSELTEEESHAGAVANYTRQAGKMSTQKLKRLLQQQFDEGDTAGTPHQVVKAELTRRGVRINDATGEGGGNAATLAAPEQADADLHGMSDEELDGRISAGKQHLRELGDAAPGRYVARLRTLAGERSRRDAANGPAKSVGHVGFYADQIKRQRELYKASDGSLRSAKADAPVDAATGQRGGKWEASPETADAHAKHLMDGGAVIKRRGGPSMFDKPGVRRKPLSYRFRGGRGDSAASRRLSRCLEMPRRFSRALGLSREPADYWREVDNHPVPFTGSPGSGKIAIGKGAGSGKTGGMHEWTNAIGKKISFEPKGDDADLRIDGEQKRFTGYGRNAAGDAVAKYHNSAYDAGSVKLPEHLSHLADDAATATPVEPSGPPASADYHHAGSGLHFKVRGDRVEVGGNTYEHRVALKRAGLDFDDEAKVYRGHRSAVEHLNVPRHWEIPKGLGIKVKNKIGG